MGFKCTKCGSTEFDKQGDSYVCSYCFSSYSEYELRRADEQNKQSIAAARGRIDDVRSWAKDVSDRLCSPKMNYKEFCEMLEKSLDERFSRVYETIDSSNMANKVKFQLLDDKIGNVSAAMDEFKNMFAEMAAQIPVIRESIPDSDPEKDKKIAELEAKLQSLLDKYPVPEKLPDLARFFAEKLDPPQYGAAYLVLRQAVENFFRFRCGGDQSMKLLFQKDGKEMKNKEKYQWMLNLNSKTPFIKKLLSKISVVPLSIKLKDLYKRASENVHGGDDIKVEFYNDLDLLEKYDLFNVEKDYLKLFENVIKNLEVAKNEGRINENDMAELKMSKDYHNDSYSNINVSFARDGLKKYLDLAEKEAKAKGDKNALESIKQYKQEYSFR